MNWYFRAVLSNYANFSGRASRKEYWYFVLFNTIFAFGISLSGRLSGSGSIESVVYSLALLIPSLSVAVRRAHDSDKSGWHIGICHITFYLGLFMAVFGFVTAEAASKSRPWLEVAPGYTLFGFAGLFIVLMSLIYPLVILLAPGTVGPNRFGGIPPIE